MGNKSGGWLSLVCVLATGFCCVGCDSSKQSGHNVSNQDQYQSAQEKGIREAKAAIADGNLKLKEYPPLPNPPGHSEYTALLREKCGVETEAISTPKFSKVLQQEVSAWNDTMRSEIERKFGDDIFEQLRDEAKQKWQDKLSRKDKG